MLGIEAILTDSSVHLGYRLMLQEKFTSLIHLSKLIGILATNLTKRFYRKAKEKTKTFLMIVLRER